MKDLKKYFWWQNQEKYVSNCLINVKYNFSITLGDKY
jgi:hypothetical protein